MVMVAIVSEMQLLRKNLQLKASSKFSVLIKEALVIQEAKKLL